MVIAVFIFIIGLIVGSFLNVCIHRMPRAESIVFPPSGCPYCNNKIQWYDNIPLLSYILLKGHCRYCNVKIPLRYFIVELLTGLFFLFLFYHYGVSPTPVGGGLAFNMAKAIKFFIYSVFSCFLFIAAFVDIKYRIIPDEISLGGVILGLILSFTFPQMHASGVHLTALTQALIGVFCGAGITYLTGVIGTIIFRKEAMGLGDVKLMGMIGAFLGWKLSILAFFIAPFFGAAYGIIVLLKKKSHLIPYGPFLSLGALIALFYGQHILRILFWGI